MMADQLKFLSYRRSRAATNAKPSGSRLTGQIKLTLSEINGTAREDKPVEFRLMGPLDVRGLKPGSVRRTYPADGAFNVETDKCPYAEFAADDLPWRYSPDPNGETMKPWLMLIAGTAENVLLLPGKRVVFSGKLVRNYINTIKPAARAHLMAHVQEPGVSRLLYPGELEPGQSYIAVLVPAFSPESFKQPPARKITLQANVPVPYYHVWRFTTSESDGSFIHLAKRLYALKPIPGNVGIAPVAYQTSADQTTIKPQMFIGGALVGLNDTVPAFEDPEMQKVLDHFKPLRPDIDSASKHDEKGRPILKMPLYGEPWHISDDNEQEWMKELNDDPRNRGVAGLGMWAGIEWQERIVYAASKQMGAFYTAALRIRQLTAGLAASRSLWDRRLPADEIQRLQVLGMSLAGMATTKGGSVLDHITGENRPLPSVMFSSAARRIFRPGTARARLARQGALAPGPLFDGMNTCPPDVRDHPEGLLHASRFLRDGSLEDSIAEAVARRGEFGYGDYTYRGSKILDEAEQNEREAIGLETDSKLIEILRNVAEDEGMRREFLEEIHAPFPSRVCEDQGADLSKLSSILHDAINPHGNDAFIVRRVLATIKGLDDQPLTPPELCLDFEIPAWKFLKEFAKDWLLPGLDDMYFKSLGENGETVRDNSMDPVIAARTNARFTDAFLTGFNQQALAELRWRNIPIATGCTPLRRFWEPIRPDPPESDGKPGEDITEIHTWLSDTKLGDIQHETDEARGENLVLIFKSQLWRRYPETLIYLLPEQNGIPDWNMAHIQPNLHIEIEPDVVAFGFTQNPDILDTHWVVIEQIPRGFTFYNLPTTVVKNAIEQPGINSAQFAAAAFATPVRVLIRGSELKPMDVI